MTDLLRRKYADGVLPARMERRRQPLRQLVATELYGCNSICRTALPPPIPSDVLVGRALQSGTAESSFAEPPSAPSTSAPSCQDVTFATALAGEVVLPTYSSLVGAVPDLPIVAEREVVWPRGQSCGLPAAVKQFFLDLCGGERVRPSFLRGGMLAGADSAVLHPCHQPEFVGVELVEAASPFGTSVARDSGRWCEALSQALPLRRLVGEEPAGRPGHSLVAVEASFGSILPRSLPTADHQVRRDVSLLVQSTSPAYWEIDAVAQAKALLVGVSSGKCGLTGGTDAARDVEHSIVDEEHQTVPREPSTIDCPVLASFVAATDVSMPVSRCTSLPCPRAVAQAALQALEAGGPATAGMWARRLFEDTSALPWRWHWDQTDVVIGAPPAWTLDEAADRALEASLRDGTAGLAAPRALPDVRRHVDSLWRVCAAVAARYKRGEVAALDRSFAHLVGGSQTNGHARATGQLTSDPAVALENKMCSYDNLEQPVSVTAGAIEPRRPGQSMPRVPVLSVNGGSVTPSAGMETARDSPGVIATPMGGGSFKGAPGRLGIAQKQAHPVRHAHFAPSMPSLSPPERVVPADERLLQCGERLETAGTLLVPDGAQLAPAGERSMTASEQLVPAGEVAFSEADSSTLVPTSGSGSRSRLAPASGSSSGRHGGSCIANMAHQVAVLDGFLSCTPQPLRVLRNPQQLNVAKTQLDAAAQLLGHSTVLVLPPPMQPFSLTCLLAETYLCTRGFDHRCLWVSSASTASLTYAFEFHQLALPDHHLVLLDAEPRASSRATAAAARFVFASVSAARALLADHALFSFVVFDSGASDFQAIELADLVALQPQLRLVPSTAVLLVEDAVSPLGVADRDLHRIVRLADRAQCGVSSALVRRSTDAGIQGVVRASINDYVEPSVPVLASLRVLDAAAASLIRPLWLRRHPAVCVTGGGPAEGGLSLPPAPDAAPALRDLVADNLSGAVIQMQDEFAAAAGPMQTTLVGRGSLSDLKAMTTLHVLRCARDHALLHGVDTCLQFLQEAQAHYDGQVQCLGPWCQRIEEEMWDAGAGQPSVTAALQQIVASETGSVLIVTGPRDLATVSAALPSVRRLNQAGLTEPASPLLSSSESSSTADVLVADHDDLASVSDALYPRLALVVLVSTTPPAALLQFINAGAVRCRYVQMSEAAVDAQREEEQIASRFDAALQH